MLRLSRSRLLVSLAPDAVSWLKLEGHKPKVVAKQTMSADAGYGGESWQGALATLRAIAQEWRKETASVTIVLSNHFARYVLVPPTDGISGVKEENALALFYFSKVHGERTRGWDLRLSDMQGNTPRLACAIDTSLLDELRKCFPAKGTLKLVSVQPLLMSAFNYSRGQLPAEGAWMLLIEAQRACLGLVAGRRWIAVQNVKGNFSEEQTWVELLDQARLRIDLPSPPDAVLVHAPLTNTAPQVSRGTWQLRRLQITLPAGLTPLEDATYTTALTAA